MCILGPTLLAGVRPQSYKRVRELVTHFEAMEAKADLDAYWSMRYSSIVTQQEAVEVLSAYVYGQFPWPSYLRMRENGVPHDKARMEAGC